MTGADESEIVMANSLTVNNALLLEAFYLPNFKTGRKKILIMEHSFASDQAVVMSVIKQKVALLKQNGLARDISDNIERMREQMVVILPSDKDGLYSISTLRQILKTHGSTIALAHLEGIPFTTGQKFYSNDVNDLLREYNIRIGWDLAHVVGNRSVSLHEDGVDYATWCGYKYLGASAGGVGGYFINNKNQINKDFFPLQGWKAMRSDMVFSKIHSFDSSLFYDDARGTRLGNPPPVEMGDAQAVLELFDEIGVKNVENRSKALTNHLIKLLQDRLRGKIRFITPLLEDQHGAMIVFQLKTDKSAEDIEKLLQKHNFSVDVRPPANIRIMPHPLYVDFQDVEKFVDTMALAL
ncbi:MAG: Kynureninase [bacterium ADurb.BinA186]|nr:MAG: Kynureninase [bacterium ADurb.BinA186]